MAYPVLGNVPLQDLYEHDKKSSELCKVMAIGLAITAGMVAIFALPLGLLNFEGMICTENCCIALGVVASLSLTATLTVVIVCLCFAGKSAVDAKREYPLPCPIPLKWMDAAQEQALCSFNAVEDDESIQLCGVVLPPEMSSLIFEDLSPLNRTHCASVSRAFWSFNAVDEPYWKKVCEKEWYLPDLGETHYQTFLRHKKWMSPRIEFGLIKTQPVQDFKHAYLSKDLLLANASEGSTQLRRISIEDGSTMLFQPIESDNIQIRGNKLFCIDKQQNVSIFELPTLILVTSLQVPFRIRDMTQIGNDFFFMCWDEEAAKSKIMRLNSQTKSFHQAFVLERGYRFCSNSPEGLIVCVGWSHTIYGYDYQGNKRFEIQADINPDASYVIGSRFLATGIGNAVHIWDLQKGACVRNIALHADANVVAIEGHGLDLTICTQNSVYVTRLCNPSGSMVSEVGQ